MRIIIAIGLLIPTFSFSQIYEQEVIGTTGDYFESGSISLSWTIGEVAVEHYASSGSFQITEGFHNPIVVPGNVTEIENDFSFNLFPNPTNGELEISFTNEFNYVDVQVFNALGQVVYSVKVTGPYEMIDLSELNAGLYFVSFIADNELIETQRIEKY